MRKYLKKTFGGNIEQLKLNQRKFNSIEETKQIIKTKPRGSVKEIRLMKYYS